MPERDGADMLDNPQSAALHWLGGRIWMNLHGSRPGQSEDDNNKILKIHQCIAFDDIKRCLS